MTSSPLPLLTWAAAVGSGGVAGVFFAFSTFVMPALARLPPAQGIAAMQAINAAAINRWFMGALFGTATACLVLAIAGLRAWGAPGAGLRLAGGMLYLGGAVVLTAAIHVPRNEALAALSPAAPGAAQAWATYVSSWTSWNHLRAVLPALAALAFAAAPSLGAAPPAR